MPRQRFGHQPRRIREVGEQRAGRHFANILRDAQDHRNGSQRLGHAPDAGRLLADEPVPQTEILIPAAGGHQADPQLRDDVLRARNCLALIA